MRLELNSQMDLIKSVLKFNNEGRFVKALDLLFDDVLKYINSQEWVNVDLIIQCFTNEKFHIKTFIGLLTITNPVRDKLKFYSVLYDAALNTATSTGYSLSEAQELLSGYGPDF